MNTINTLEGKAEVLEGLIKKGDTFFNPHSGQIHLAASHTDIVSVNKNGCKKIKLINK